MNPDETKARKRQRDADAAAKRLGPLDLSDEVETESGVRRMLEEYGSSYGEGQEAGQEAVEGRVAAAGARGGTLAVAGQGSVQEEAC